MEEASDAGDDKSQSNHDDDVNSCDDQESLVDSADYDTDLDVAGQSAIEHALDCMCVY